MIQGREETPVTTQMLTLHVPETLFTRLKERADQAHRSVEAETLVVLATAVPLSEALPADLAEALEPLGLLDDDALREAARHRLTPEVAAQIDQLHLKQQREGLTEAERQTLAALVRQYEQTMLVRAQAAALLKQRGHDVRDLVVPG
jgi:plasmid stability protein